MPSSTKKNPPKKQSKKKPSTWTKSFLMTPLPYQVKITFCENLFEAVKAHDPSLGDGDDFNAITYSSHGLSHIFYPKEVSVNTFAHELMHAIIAINEQVDIPMTVEGSEATCYQTGRLFHLAVAFADKLGIELII